MKTENAVIVLIPLRIRSISTVAVEDPATFTEDFVLIPLRIRSISTAALPKPRRARVCGPVCANLGAVNPF